MKTISEYRSDTGDYTAEVLWYAKNKRWVVRCYFAGREIDEQIFPTECEAELCADDYVLQGNQKHWDQSQQHAAEAEHESQDRDPEDTGPAE